VALADRQIHGLLGYAQSQKKSMNKFFQILIVVVLILLSLDVFFEVNFPKINEISIESDKIKKEIRIIQISDLHGKEFPESIFRKIKEKNPDIIVLTGDLIDEKIKDYSYVYSFIDSLALNDVPMYYVSGNHDLSHKDVETFNQELMKRGVMILDEDKAEYGEIDIYGLGYYSDPAKLEKPNDNFSLLLIHDAFPIVKQEGMGFDLILSGHTHGGQVRLPFLGAVFVPGQGLFAKYDKGLFNLNEKTRLYIDSGLGNTFLPLRFLNRSQVSLITLYSK
jgi:hypothetical protein